jgi:hypothetical protein
MTAKFDKYIQFLLESMDDEQTTVGIDGEYWFDERGHSMYADGDAGDMNHEMYVIERCKNEVLSNIGIHDDGDYSMDTYEEEIVKFLAKEWNYTTHNAIDKIRNDVANALIEYHISQFKYAPQKANDLVMTAYACTRDAREYAIKNWGWSRVHGDSIETLKLDAKTLKNIASGINDAISQESLYDRYDDSSVFDNHEYTISTYTGKRYTITLGNMEAGNVSDLELDLAIKKTAATQQVRDMDMKETPDYYKQRGVLGDSVQH